MSKQKAIIVSGYFNPIHKGHLEYFNNAKALFINGGGKSLDISTASTGDINISDNSSVDLSAVNAEENIRIKRQNSYYATYLNHQL
mgnify:CR=1 FL=1